MCVTQSKKPERRAAEIRVAQTDRWRKRERAGGRSPRKGLGGGRSRCGKFKGKSSASAQATSARTGARTRGGGAPGPALSSTSSSSSLPFHRGPSPTMIPTAPCLSKALRRALTPKRGNKDYYKGASPASAVFFVSAVLPPPPTRCLSFPRPAREQNVDREAHHRTQEHARRTSRVDTAQARRESTSCAARPSTGSSTARCACSSPRPSRTSKPPRCAPLLSYPPVLRADVLPLPLPLSHSRVCCPPSPYPTSGGRAAYRVRCCDTALVLVYS